MLAEAFHLARRVVTWPFRYRRLPNKKDLTRWRLWLNSHLQHRAPSLVINRALWRVDPYELWLRNNAWNEKAERTARQILDRLESRPKFSILIPTFNPPLRWLERAIDSVRRQVYPHWEICIADDASTDPAVTPFLNHAGNDPRIRVEFRQANGHISKASNSAAKLATGDYVVLLDQDDELTPDCLLELAGAAQGELPDVIYSDEDKVDAEGKRRDPHFKPDWSPEFLLACNYMCHVFAVRRELFHAVGGFRIGFEGAQDHDLALRVAEQAKRIVHVPKVLYHWRTLPSSTAASGVAKTYAYDAGVRTVQQALERRNLAGKAIWPGKCRERHYGGYQIDFPDSGPIVTIIVPTKNRVDLLRRCLDSLRKTSYRNFDVLVIDNESDDPETLAYLDEIRSQHRVVRLANPDGRFNYARLHNQVVPLIDSEYLLLLNNDTEIVRPEWLSQMVGYAGFPGVGAVGARLLYPDGSAQHVGVVMGLGGMVGHVRKHRKPADPISFRDEVLAANYNVVTAACLLVKRSLYQELGGLDEERFGVAYNDVDFCLKLRERGLRCVYAPRAEIIHHESVSRGATVQPHELQAFRTTWNVAEPDPYYNPNLSPHCDFQQIGTRRLLPSRYHRAEPLKVTVALPDLGWNGTSLSAIELAEALAGDNIQPTIISFDGGPMVARCRQSGIGVQRFPNLPSRARMHSIQKHVAKIAAHYQRQEPDLLWAHGLPAFPAVAAAYRSGVPVLWTLRQPVDWHAWFREHYPAYFDELHELFHSVYQLVATSYEMFHFDLEKLSLLSVVPAVRPREELHALAASVDQAGARRQLNLPADEQIVTILGPIDASRRLADVIPAALQVLEGGMVNLRFLFVGCDTWEARRWKRTIGRFADRFAFLPPVESSALYVRASDLLVNTPAKSSYSRGVQEAFALDVPVVTAPFCGFGSFLIDGVNVLRWEPETASVLADAIRRGLTDGALRKRLKEQGRRTLDALPTFAETVNEHRTLLHEAALCSPQRYAA